MSYWVKAVVGFGLLVGGIAAFLYSLYELMKTGTCSSGGPYVIAVECPIFRPERRLPRQQP